MLVNLMSCQTTKKRGFCLAKFSILRSVLPLFWHSLWMHALPASTKNMIGLPNVTLANMAAAHAPLWVVKKSAASVKMVTAWTQMVCARGARTIAQSALKMVLKSAKSANQVTRSTMAIVSMALAPRQKPNHVILTNILSIHGVQCAMIVPMVALGVRTTPQPTKQLVLVANLVL